MSTRILAGRYELLERIGDGGMAIVYKARCRLLNRFVAIKILKPDFVKDVKFIENFRKESQAAASLTHPNIVNVYDVGREGNIHYIVMELIEGKVLSQLIKEEAPLDYMRSIDITKQIAAALSFAHKNQIIHRDVKPHNILITQEGTAKITDFGIAKALNTATIVGNEGTVMGSVHYFSPEQARGGYVDEKSDIYSLGIVLYEMLTGRVPFDGDNPVTVALMHVNEEMILPSKLVDGIPPRLEQIAMKAADKFQVNRYKSADEMLDALGNLEFVTSIVGDSAVGGIRRSSGVSGAIHPEEKEKGKEGAEDMAANEKPEKGKRKFKINRIKLLAVALALICAIPASIFIASAISGAGQPKEVEVPNLVGLTFERAEEELGERGLKIQAGLEVFDAEYDEGKVVSQDPVAESIVKEGKTVTVNTSKGTNQGTIPKITGKSKEDAMFLIDKYGYAVGLQTSVKNDLPKGIIISQDPEPGTEAKPGTAINFRVSEGKAVEEAIMPSVVNQEASVARELIEKAGLKLSDPEYEASEAYEKNKIMWQEYKAGDVLDAGTPVKLKISLGKEETPGAEEPAEPTDKTDQTEPTEPTEPKPIKLNIPFDGAANQIFLLTVMLTDETGTHYIISSEQKIRENGPETITLNGVGSGTVTVIFDDQVQMRKNVNFNTGEIS